MTIREKGQRERRREEGVRGMEREGCATEEACRRFEGFGALQGTGQGEKGSWLESCDAAIRYKQRQEAGGFDPAPNKMDHQPLPRRPTCFSLTTPLVSSLFSSQALRLFSSSLARLLAASPITLPSRRRSRCCISAARLAYSASSSAAVAKGLWDSCAPPNSSWSYL